MRKNRILNERLAVSVDEMAGMLGISRNLAYSMVKSGEIPSTRLGERRILIPVAAVEALFNQDPPGRVVNE